MYGKRRGNSCIASSEETGFIVWEEEEKQWLMDGKRGGDECIGRRETVVNAWEEERKQP